MTIQYSKHLTQPVNNPNISGKYVISDQSRLERFLILGSEGGTYYASERKLTIQNAECVKRLVSKDDTGLQAVRTIVAVSDAGRAPKNDPALLALAIAVKFGTPLVRSEALAALPKVARIGTHLFHFLDYAKALGIGWGRSFRRAISKWYNDRSAHSLARQLVKYQSRDGWSNRDALRLAHPTPKTPEHQALFHWAVKGEGEGKAWDFGSAVEHVHAYERLKKVNNVQDAVALIVKHGLPREAVPTQFLNSPEVWQALLADMKPEATLRNLGKLTNIGLLKPLSSEVRLVIDRLTDPTAIKESRLHPIKVLVALLTYQQGHGNKGSLTWSPNQQVVNALNEAFYLSFGNVEPTGKRTLKAIDVSASMTWGECAGAQGINPRVGSALMAMVTARVEPNWHVVGFCTQLQNLAINPKMSLQEIVNVIDRTQMGATDVSLPMVWAQKNGIEVDSFEVYTDNETNSHRISPANALRSYRDKTGIDAKLVVVGMTATDVSVADPNDPNMMDVVGFDTNAPAIIADFIRG